MKPKRAKSNRCCRCGRFVGERFAGYEHERCTKRGKLWCERCLTDSREE